MKYRKIVTVLIILLILCFGFYQYMDKQHYVRYMSHQLSGAVSGMSSALYNNQIMYEEILDSRSITLEQMDMILSYNGSFGVKVRELKMIAVNFFERASDEELNSITAFTASDINSFFYEIQWDIVYEEKLDNLSDLTTILSKNERIKLNEDELEHIHTIQALNSLWREALINNINGINPDTGTVNTDLFFDIYREKGFIKDDWINLLIDFDSITTEFLEEHEKFEATITK
ncbi:hypothetical protein [Oceanobacillus sp. FSL K6-0127]|uniref:hypothetical protein n=1 Tax=Oceanobacillus sp. FSL K6-0127 TaxID=2921420 RepID=UPI0030EE4D4C